MGELIVRPARPQDAQSAAALLLEIPGGLSEIVGDRAAAGRVAGGVFAARRSVVGWDRALVAERAGRLVGLIVAMDGPDWRARRVSTGLAMVRAAGIRRAWRILRRGPLEERLVPPVPPDALHVVALAVAPEHRGSGVGSELLAHAIRVAEDSGLRRMTLDVGPDNAGAVRLYEKNGFVAVSEHHRPAMRGLQAASSIRMERPLEPR